MDSQTKTKAVNLEDLQISVREVFNKGFGNSGTCATAADTPAKEVTLGTIFSLVNGCTLLVKFTNGITSENSTLAVTHTVDGASVTEAAKPIYLNGAYVEDDAVPAGAVLILRYNGTQFEIVGGAGVNSGSAGGSFYTPTLSDTPTESTLTYTKDGKTYAFEIGQFCRVADASAPLGYKFYQLFDIAQNGTVAKWNAYATKIPSEYTAPTPKTLTYNTEAQALLNAGSSDDGTIQYSSDGTNWSTTIPTRTDAGTYNVYWRLNGDAQHQDVNATLISVTIAPKEVASPTITLSDDSYTYDGTAKEPTVTAKDGNDVIPSTDYTVTYSNNTNAGTATVEVEDNGGNYAFEGSVTFTIAKADGSVTTIPASRGVTYNGNAQIVADAGAGTGTMMYRFGDTGEFSSSIPTLTDAGEYTLYYYATESANYNQSQTGNITVTVAKAAPTYSSPSAKSLTYTGSAQDLLNAGSTSDGTIQYSGDGGTTWSTTIPQGTNADDYAPQWKLVGDNNHNDVSAITINVSIAKANPTYTAPTAKTLTYNGNAQELLNAGTTNDGTISYSSDNDNWGSSIPQWTNADSYTVYWKLTGDANHNDVASTTINVSIAKVTPTVTAPTAKVLTYDGTAQELVNAGSTDYGTLQYSLDDETYSTSIPSGTNAGDYSVYYKVVGDSNVNDVAAQNVSVSIAKANRSASFSGNETSLEVDDVDTISVTTVGSPTITLSSSNTDVATVSGMNITAVGGGTATITATIAGDINYNEATISYTLTSHYGDGVYAVKTNGQLTKSADINTSTPNAYVGVALIDNSKNIKYFLNKEFTYSGYKCIFKNAYQTMVNYEKELIYPSYCGNVQGDGGDGQSIQGAAPANLRTNALTDWNSGRTGISVTNALQNDPKIIADKNSIIPKQLQTDFPNPITGEHNGYIYHLVELIALNDNQVEVNQILNNIGGVPIVYNMGRGDSYTGNSNMYSCTGIYKVQGTAWKYYSFWRWGINRPTTSRPYGDMWMAGADAGSTDGSYVLRPCYPLPF